MVMTGLKRGRKGKLTIGKDKSNEVGFVRELYVFIRNRRRR